MNKFLIGAFLFFSTAALAVGLSNGIGPTTGTVTATDGTFGGNVAATGTLTGSNLSGTNTGDQLYNRAPVRVATFPSPLPSVTYSNGTAGVGATLTEVGNGPLFIDGVNPTASPLPYRVAVTSQASGLQNGIYDVTNAGSAGSQFVLTRSSDYNTSALITYGSSTKAVEGTANSGVIFIMNQPTAYATPITVGTTNITFEGNSATQGGTLSGAGAANRLAYWSGASALTSSANGTWDGTTETIVGNVRFTSGAAGTVAEILKLASSQTADAWQLQTNASAVLANIDASGRMGLGAAASSAQELIVQPASSTIIAQTLRGEASQTADLLKAQDSTGADVARVASDGTVYAGGNSVSNIQRGLIVNSGAGTSSSLDIFQVKGSSDNNMIITDPTNNRTGFGTATPSSKVGISGDLSLETAGNGIYIKEGSNATMGTGTLTAGTVVISTTKVTANSRIFITDTGGGVLANIGALYISARSAGTSFTVSSSNAIDTSTFNWVILEPR